MKNYNLIKVCFIPISGSLYALIRLLSLNTTFINPDLSLSLNQADFKPDIPRSGFIRIKKKKFGNFACSTLWRLVLGIFSKVIPTDYRYCNVPKQSHIKIHDMSQVNFSLVESSS